jgi:hypothetical protein
MKRPTSVTVFGVLNIVFGVFGIIGMIGTIAVFAMPQVAHNNPALQVMQDNPAYLSWMKLTIPLGLLSTLASFPSATRSLPSSSARSG